MIDRAEHEEPDPRRALTIDEWLDTLRYPEVDTWPVDDEIGYTTSDPGEIGSW